MITSSDATIVRSLLRKAQSVSLQLVEDAGAKRLHPKDRAIKAKLVHCYVTVALGYMIEGQQ